jgi:hypothetical protein
VRGHLLALAPEEQPREPSQAAGPHDDQVHAVRIRRNENGLRGRAFKYLGRQRAGDRPDVLLGAEANP